MFKIVLWILWKTPYSGNFDCTVRAKCIYFLKIGSSIFADTSCKLWEAKMVDLADFCFLVLLSRKSKTFEKALLIFRNSFARKTLGRCFYETKFCFKESLYKCFYFNTTGWNKFLTPVWKQICLPGVGKTVLGKRRDVSTRSFNTLSFFLSISKVKKGFQGAERIYFQVEKELKTSNCVFFSQLVSLK